MDENCISGTAKNIGGKVEEGIGRVTGDTKTQAAGVARQVSGSAQDMYGQARDAVSDMSDTARDTASSFEKIRQGRSRLSRTLQSLSRSEWDGYWAGCTAPCSGTMVRQLLGDRYGHDNASHHHYPSFVSRRRWLVRPGPLVLDLLNWR